MEEKLSVDILTNSQVRGISDHFVATCLSDPIWLQTNRVHILEEEGGQLVREMRLALRRFVEARASIIVRHVKVDRTMDPTNVIEATQRLTRCRREVLESMPRQGGMEDDVFFVKLDRQRISVADIEFIYQEFNLVPDPYAQAKVNIDDPFFADNYPNMGQWKDDSGSHCFISFWGEAYERYISSDRYDGLFLPVCWVAGVRKIQLQG